MEKQTNKVNQRKICIENRKGLSLDIRNNYSHIICEKLKPYLIDKAILSYSPFLEEVDVNEINNTFEVYYPVISKDKTMKAYKPNNNLFIRDFYGIKEPDINDATYIDSKDLDVIIVPMVGFDLNKYRLGNGGGYYDRYLMNTDALKIGVAYDIQKCEFPVEEFDIALDKIITEKNIY